MFAMAGGSRQHSLLKTNTTIALGTRLRGRTCTVYDSDLRVLISATGLFVYPDVSVVCDPMELFDGDNLTNPTLIVEVLSDSTETYDRTTKFDHSDTFFVSCNPHDRAAPDSPVRQCLV